MIWKAIKFITKAIALYMKRKAVEAEQAIKNKMLKRGNHMREKEMPVNAIALEPPNA